MQKPVTHPIDLNYIQDLAGTSSMKEARKLLTRGHLWNYTDRLDEPREEAAEPQDIIPPGYAGAYVLGKDPEPFRVLWSGEEWSCECGSGYPCSHLNALLVQLAEKRGKDQRLSALQSQKNTQALSEDSVSSVNELDPHQDLLFFAEPDEVEKKSVLILGRRKSIIAPLNRHSVPKNSNPGFLDMKGDAWFLGQAHIIIKDDGSISPPRPDSDSAPDLKTIPELINLLHSEKPPVTPGGETWILETAVSIILRFEPLLTATDDDPLYAAVVDVSAGNEILSGGLFPAGDKLLILDEGKAVSALLSNTGSYIWFIRLMFSRKILSASDIRARLSGENRIPEGIRVVMPDLPESLKMLEPRLILEISSHMKSTDFLPRWRYGEFVISPEKKGDIIVDAESTPLGLRNKEAEEELLSQAEALLISGLSWQRGRYSRLSGNSSIPLRLEMSLTEVLAEYGNTLIDSGVEIRLEDRPVRKGSALNIQTRQNGDMLELNTLVVSGSGTDNINLDEWFERGGLVGARDAYFTLKDKDLKQLKFLKTHGMDEKGFLSTSPENLSLIDTVYADIEADEEIILTLERKRSIYKSLMEFNPENFPQPPEEFNAKLRPYQFHGYAWLLFLREKELGGCLADDMGLGKTVQTLAYLSRLKTDGNLAASLMVGPVVTLANWEAEMRRFTPMLKYHRYSGPVDKRYIPGHGTDIDLVIVSYQTLRNDIEKFLDRDWDHIILDEAHYIKNSSSRTFKAVRSIRAAHRISLTGTPLENHLNELWSQMSFLNPGLLGNQFEFSKRYVKPMEKEGNSEILNRLSNTVRPFILRRKKADVLHDLPPKDETILRCEMTPDQAEAYHAARAIYFRQVTGLLSDEGLAGARIQIFTILSKLRLLAIHPPLAGEQFKGISSGKMTVLDNLMEEILEEDHKTLVFSQFLGALDRAESTCRQHGWQFSRLTGSTRNREVPIRQFQEDPDTRVFLLSLKAGGVGINLTAADYVILLDPWWNPAVEAQAVDRAHRMGQTRPVMAYRLITEGTIEEKVLELQERKKDLIAGVLGEGSNPKLSEKDLLKLLE